MSDQATGDHAGLVRWLPAVCDVFGVEEPAGIPLLGGTTNISFVVGNDKPVIVTFCTGMAVPWAEGLAALLDHLQQHDFPTNRILRTQTGDLVYVVDGTPVIVKEYVPGSPVSVTFDNPIDVLEVFLAIRNGGQIVLTALDADGISVGTLSGPTGNSAQAVSLSGPASRVEVIYTGDGDGWIDDFTFGVAPTSSQ